MMQKFETMANVLKKGAKSFELLLTSDPSSRKAIALIKDLCIEKLL